MKCSRANWLIDLNGELNNLVLIHTLRDSSDAGLRSKLMQLLSLDYARNEERMVVEPIARLTRPQVLDLLADVKLVVHTLAQETVQALEGKHGWRLSTFYGCNSRSTILFLDYEFEKSTSKLVRFHQTADADIKKENLKDAKICAALKVQFSSVNGAHRPYHLLTS